MKQSRPQILLLLALLLSWGQVLAAPFMPCHHQLAGVAALAAAELQAGHEHAAAAASQQEHLHAVVHVAEADASRMPAHDHAALTDTCDPECRLQCVSILVLALPALAFAATDTAPAVHGAAVEPHSPAQPPAAHFRPPQAA